MELARVSKIRFTMLKAALCSATVLALLMVVIPRSVAEEVEQGKFHLDVPSFTLLILIPPSSNLLLRAWQEGRPAEQGRRR